MKRSSPLEKPNLEVTSFGPVSELFKVFVYGDVFEELHFASSYRESEICAAILTGTYAHNGHFGFVEVTGFDGLVYLESDALLIREMAEGAKSMESSAELLTRAGFFASRRGSRGLMNHDIAMAHLTLFNAPFQPAIVLDPDTNEFGVYVRAASRKFESVGFSLVTRSAPEEFSPLP